MSKLRPGGSGAQLPQRKFFHFPFLSFLKISGQLWAPHPPVQWIQCTVGNITRPGDDAAHWPLQVLRLWMIGAISFLPAYTFLAWIGTALSFILYRGADKSLARTTSWCILFDSENISFDASLVIYINSTDIPPIMIINRIYEHQNLL